MKNEPALVILIPGFPKDESDSTCLPAQQSFIKDLNRQFPLLRVLILCFQYPFSRSAYCWNNNTVYAFAGKNKGGLPRLLLWQRVRKKLNQLKKENNIVGVLSFWGGECTLVGTRWAKKNGIRHYGWLMGQDAKKENHYIKRSGSTGAALISLSDFIAEELDRNHAIKTGHVIPIGVEPARFHGADQERNIDILAAGSLIPLKRYHLCIEVIKEVKKSFPAVRMILLGKGPESGKLNSLIRAYDLQENILLAGEKKHPEVLALMMRSKIFLHPSSYEGFGIACLEALAAGAHVISFHQPMKERIEKWHIVQNPEKMVEKTLSLLNTNPDHTPGYPYTIGETSRKIMKLFEL